MSDLSRPSRHLPNFSPMECRGRGSSASPSTAPRPAGASCTKSRLARDATFAMDMATRDRGYGLIRVGIYDMRLTPVGAPPPPWP